MERAPDCETINQIPFDKAMAGCWVFEVATGELAVSARTRAVVLRGTQLSSRELGKGLLIVAQDRPRVLAAMLKCRKTREDFDIRFRLDTAEGHFWARAVGGPIVEDHGSVRRLAGVILDIDADSDLKRQINEQEAHFNSILETAPDGMAVIDASGIIQSFSRSAEWMFGYSREEAIGKNIKMLMPDPDRSRHDGYMARYMATGEKHIIGIGRIVTGRRKDGSPFPLHLSIGETNAGGRRLFTGFMHDLTEERQAQSRTQQLQAELAHISRLSALGEMGSALAHELNQPLGAIGNYLTGSRRLLADLAGPAAAKIEGALEKAAEQTLRAGNIIRRLRDFVSRRETERRVESLAKLVEEASALGLVGAREKDVALRFELDPRCDRVLADRVQIQQVLVNLLRNGLDAMADSTRRELTVSSRRTEDGMLEISVSDTGPGIGPDAAARLFEPFFTTKPSGLGVGLSISRGIVEAHGGEMHAENNAAGGAIFRFTLPLQSVSGAGHEV